MEKKRRFLTLFGKALNVELVKMPGQIPFKMYQRHGYKASVVFYKGYDKFTYHKNVLKGLRLILLKDEGKFMGLDKSLLKFLFKYGKNIDVLHRFHYSLQTMIYVILYKMINPRGIAYVTLDNDLGSLKIYPHSLLLKHPTNFIRNFIAYNIIEPLFLKKVDLLSNETRQGTERLKNLYKKYANKFFYQPYGIDETFIKERSIRVKNFEEKENVILHVARIGAPQKNQRMLLEAISKVNLSDWRVIIAGPYEEADEFLKFVDEFFKKYPRLKEKITFLGNIEDREQLYNLYNRAKIFVMTSNFESFGLVMVEAGYFGNYVLTTNVISAMDITDNERCGDVVPIGDVEAFAKKLQYAIDHPEYIKEKAERMKTHVRNNFLWEKVVDRLQEQIEMLRK
jgi:glycosyltransferase involved in cell wall biosynthesis